MILEDKLQFSIVNKLTAVFKVFKKIGAHYPWKYECMKPSFLLSIHKM